MIPMISCKRNAHVTFVEQTQLLTLISNLKLIWQFAFKGTVVNRVLPSLHGGSLEITFTVPLNLQKFQKLPMPCLKDVLLESLTRNTNSDFVIPISFRPNLKYYTINSVRSNKFEKSKVYKIMLPRYRDQKRNWVLTTNTIFLIHISWQPDDVNP